MLSGDRNKLFNDDTLFPSPMTISNQSIVNRNYIENEALVSTVDFRVQSAVSLACVPVHYARVPPLCMDCAISSKFPSEKRSRHSAAKINYADARHI